ncbi:hypothetical protein BJ741DRAFT_333337 [Chytriomyces cf. hyalinus JEL632]|nr:hypothetical protein BJ741DRAFT_333337 [Chytriomyces cf. hyalinus JEL632]
MRCFNSEPSHKQNWSNECRSVTVNHGFCAHHEALFPIFETLSAKLGTEAAVAFLSKVRFCARADTLLPVFHSLSEKLGPRWLFPYFQNSDVALALSLWFRLSTLCEKLRPESTVSLAFFDHLYAHLDALLSVLDMVSEKIGTKNAVALLSKRQFLCARRFCASCFG